MFKVGVLFWEISDIFVLRNINYRRRLAPAAPSPTLHHWEGWRRLARPYFGGGAIVECAATTTWHMWRELPARFEDGTPAQGRPGLPEPHMGWGGGGWAPTLAALPPRLPGPPLPGTWAAVDAGRGDGSSGGPHNRPGVPL